MPLWWNLPVSRSQLKRKVGQKYIFPQISPPHHVVSWLLGCWLSSEVLMSSSSADQRWSWEISRTGAGQSHFKFINYVLGHIGITGARLITRVGTIQLFVEKKQVQTSVQNVCCFTFSNPCVIKLLSLNSNFCALMCFPINTCIFGDSCETCLAGRHLPES